jgi:hypothetical protein
MSALRSVRGVKTIEVSCGLWRLKGFSFTGGGTFVNTVMHFPAPPGTAERQGWRLYEDWGNLFCGSWWRKARLNDCIIHAPRRHKNNQTYHRVTNMPLKKKKKKVHFNVLSVNVQHMLGRTVFSSAMLTWRCFYGRMPFLTSTLVQCCTNETFRSLLHWLPTVY